MYGNSPLGTETEQLELSPDERKRLRRDLASVAARTRELLPGDFVVGSELNDGANGPRAMVAVQPPIGHVVSAGYAPGGAEVAIDDEERDEIATGLAASAALQVKQARDEIATGLAASAALQVKQAYPDEGSPAAQ